MSDLFNPLNSNYGPFGSGGSTAVYNNSTGTYGYQMNPQISRPNLPYDYGGLPVDNVLMHYNGKSGLTGVAGLGLQLFADLLRTFVNQGLQDRSTKRNQEYNDPRNQVARLKAAGINPYSVMSQVASKDVGQSHAADFDGNLNPAMFFQLQNMRLQNQLLSAEVQGRRIQNKNAALNFDFNSQSFQYRLKSAALGVVAKSLQNQLYDGKISYQDYANMIKGFDADFKSWLNTPNPAFNVGFGPETPIGVDWFYNHFRIPQEIATSKSYQNAMDEVRKNWMTATGTDFNSPSNAFGFFYKAWQMLFKLLSGQ